MKKVLTLELTAGGHVSIPRSGSTGETTDRLTRDEVVFHQALGELRSSNAHAAMANYVSAKAYQAMKCSLLTCGSVRVIGPDGALHVVTTLEHACELSMPLSARRLRQIVDDMEFLGEDLYQQCEAIGFTTRQYKAIKALPAEDRKLVQLAIESGNMEEVKNIFAELVARNEAQRQKTEAAVKEVAAKQKVIRQQSEKINELAEQLAVRDGLSADEREQHQVQKLKDDSEGAINSLTKLATTVDLVLAQPATASSELCARQSMNYVVQRLIDVCLLRGITTDLAEQVSPIWAPPVTDGLAAKPATSAVARSSKNGIA